MLIFITGCCQTELEIKYYCTPLKFRRQTINTMDVLERRDWYSYEKMCLKLSK